MVLDVTELSAFRIAERVFKYYVRCLSVTVITPQERCEIRKVEYQV